MKKTVLVVFGGVSSEHEISLISARGVIGNLDPQLYDVRLMGITRDGKSYLYDGPVELLEGDQWAQSGYIAPAVISPSTEHHGVLKLADGRAEVLHVDVVFPVLHGKNGEDGTIQGLLDLSGIPYVGCGTAASAVCMDKEFERSMADSAGIPQAKWMSLKRCDYDRDPDYILSEAPDELGFPIFVKPARAGSSVGVSRAENTAELREAVRVAFREDDKIVLEEMVDGLEVECAVLGNEDPVASVVGRIALSGELYDFEDKYVSNTSELKIPADIDDTLSTQVRAMAVRAFKAFGCTGLSRVDFFIRRSDNAVLLNEPNTMPGFTPISMYPKLFDCCGVPYGALLTRLINLAFERAGEKKEG